MSDVPRDADRPSLWRRIAAFESMAWPDMRGFLGWMFAWALCFAAASQALKADLGLPDPLAWALAVLPDVLGIAALLAYLRFLQRADELVQKIQLQGLALGFGVGVLFATGAQLLERVGAAHPAIGDTAAVMLVGWALGQLLAAWRYR